jgi:hypothetical protein
LRTTCAPNWRSDRSLLRGDADVLGDIDHDGHRQRVVPAGQIHQELPIFGPDVGRVDDSQPAGGEALAGNEMQDLEGVLGGALIGLVVGDPAAAAVGRQHLRRREMPRRETRFARAGRTDEHDEREIGNLQLHVKIPICVGGPSAGSGSPIPSNRTA